MADTSLLSRITFRAPSESLASIGLIAFCDIEHGLFEVRGIELRRTADGSPVVSFAPSRIVNGRMSAVARPVSDPARRVIQREIVAAAMREGWLP